MEWLAPVITGALATATGITAAILAFRSHRAGAKEQRAPDVNEAWAETNRARARMHLLEDMFYSLRGAFKHMARRISHQYPDFELNDEERKALEMKLPD